MSPYQLVLLTERIYKLTDEKLFTIAALCQQLRDYRIEARKHPKGEATRQALETSDTLAAALAGLMS